MKIELFDIKNLSEICANFFVYVAENKKQIKKENVCKFSSVLHNIELKKVELCRKEKFEKLLSNCINADLKNTVFEFNKNNAGSADFKYCLNSFDEDGFVKDCAIKSGYHKALHLPKFTLNFENCIIYVIKDETKLKIAKYNISVLTDKHETERSRMVGL